MRLPLSKDQLKKDILIRHIVEYENRYLNRTKPGKKENYEEQEAILKIIRILVGHEGFDVNFRNPGPYWDGTYVGYHNEVTDESITLLISLGHLFTRPRDEMFRPVNSIFSTPHRPIIYKNPLFPDDVYDELLELNPNRFELLTFTDLKTWVSRIEVASELDQEGYEGIIKLVSRVFIEKIVKNPSFLYNREWRELEKTVAELFEGLAYKVTLTPSSKDGGKDLILECWVNEHEESYIIEIKHWRSGPRVGEQSIKEFLNVVV